MNPSRWISAAILLGTMAGSAAAQAPGSARDSAGLASKQGDEALELGTRSGSEAAIRHYARANRIYRREGLSAEEASGVGTVAWLHNSLGRPDSAFFYYRRLLELYRRPELADSVGVALMLIGEVFHAQGRVDSALAYYRSALPQIRTTRVRENEGQVLSDIGAAFQRLGRPDSALAYLGMAVTIRREIRDSAGEAISLNNLALVHQALGRADSAVVYLRQSLELRRATGDRAGEGTTLNNIAFSFEKLRLNDSALAYYRQALPLLEAAGRRQTAGLVLANLGRVHLALGQRDSAAAYLDRALVILRATGDRLREAWALNDLGRVRLATQQPDAAARQFRDALALLRAAGDKGMEGEVLFNLAQSRHHRAAAPDLAGAVAYYDSAATARSRVGAAAGGDANRLTFAEQDVQLFEEWALAWLARSGEVGPRIAAEAALAAAERGRAQALLDLLRTSATAPEPTSLAADGAALVQVVQQSAAGALFYLVTRDTLLIWVIPPKGDVTVLKQPVGRDSLVRLAGELRSGLGVDDVGAADGAFRAIANLEESGGATPRRGLRFAEDAARALGEILLPPSIEAMLANAAALVIVPQGPLALVPFTVLPLGRSGSALAEPFGTRHAIRHVPSIASLREAEARTISGREGEARAPLTRALVVGNPEMPAVTTGSGATVQLAPLPSARAEAEWLGARIGAPALSGAAATETAVRRLLPGAPLVHLATHGYAFSSEERARQSFVALAPDADNDGLLTVGEVLDDPTVTLGADLVVLSACQTGLGDLKQAEGTVGLQRAFLAKGARSVLVSLWSVSDVVTDLLMKRFYTHWLAGPGAPDKAEALRRAQEDVRATPGFEHPRFWAAFQLVGAR